MQTNIFDKTDCLNNRTEVKSVLKWGRVNLDVRVSIILPVYNHVSYFKKAILSAINQDYIYPYEIIVMDNNLDNSMQENEFEKIVKQLNSSKVLYYKNEQNIGACNSWNRGVVFSHAPCFTFLHDDDEFFPYTLSRLMELKEQVGKSVIFSNKCVIDKNSCIIENKKDKKYFLIFSRRKFYRLSLFRHFITSVSCGGGALYDRQCFLELGGYKEEYTPSSDYAMHIAYAYYFGSFYNTIPTLKYRIAENDSFTVYKECLKADVFFRQCMKEKIKIPNWILDCIIHANYKYSFWVSTHLWGGKERNLFPFFDWLIIKSILVILRIKTLEI